MIKVRDLHKRFGAQVVLDGIDLDIREGEITTVIGPSGVGKSVLMRIILGILEPERGSVIIYGRDITAAKSEEEKNEIRSRLGVLFQSAALLDSLTVYDNIAFPLIERTSLSREEIHRRVVKIMEELSLFPYAFKMPQEVSLSIRKRVGVARAVVMNPSFLLFDEPNTGLDPEAGQEIYDLIEKTKRDFNISGFVISHEIPEVFSVSDRVVMLFEGKIRLDGRPADFLKSTDPAVKQFVEGSLEGPIQFVH